MSVNNTASHYKPLGNFFVVIGTGQLEEVCSVLRMGQLQYI